MSKDSLEKLYLRAGISSVKTIYPICEGENITFKVNKESVYHKRKAIERFNGIKIKYAPTL